MREVIGLLDASARTGPTVGEWGEVLPAWFVSACSAQMSQSEAVAWVQKWRGMSAEDQAAAELERRWSLADWLYWMGPAQATWKLADAVVVGPHLLMVSLRVDEWPAPIGSFRWLARTAGASDVVI